ncbi:MAG TPA: undecaprenyl-diphosphate phosphatase [Noviherbaspirillum sp.]|nr:undecaprenyl-diphosphate phosphatase [Noviherbaspirillum sp.]
MDLTLAFKAFLLGIVEGFTEFLPISSTGHLILVGSMLDFNDDKAKVFEIAIQSGALLAVCWEYRARIMETVSGLFSDAAARRFAINIFIAFLPLAVLGLLFIKAIKAFLFAPVPVALAFIIGGFIILIVEARAKAEPAARVPTMDDMSPLDALKVGLLQAVSLIPGTSRSGASIIGGMWIGMSRKAATEFSFFLAIPTLFGATAYSMYKYRDLFSADDIPWFGTGAVAAFVSAFLCVRWLLHFISRHDFRVFGWYRIVVGLLILGAAWFGWTH